MEYTNNTIGRGTIGAFKINEPKWEESVFDESKIQEVVGNAKKMMESKGTVAVSDSKLSGGGDDLTSNDYNTNASAGTGGL